MNDAGQPRGHEQPPDQAEELREALRQLRHLGGTVVALRAALEESEAGRAAAVQAAVAAAQDEIRVLRLAVASLRDELESLAADKAGEVQQAVAAGLDEAHQLQATIQVLRDELERARLEHETARAGDRRDHQAEMRQLQESVAELRKRLGDSHAP